MPAPAERINVELRMLDLASKETRQFEGRVKRMARTSERSFQRANRAAASMGKTLGALAGGVAGIYAAFRVGRAAVGAGFGFVDAAATFEEAMSKFRIVFGDEAGRVEATIDQLSAKVGRAKGDFVAYTAGFQDLLVPMGLSREAAADLSLALTQLATDVASFSNKQDADVINDFTSALVGQSRPVLKYGAVLTEANVVQEAYRKGIAEVGAELTDQQKILARASLLFESTTDSQGDALRTTDSYTNSLKRMKAGIGDIKEALGTQLIAELQRAKSELGGTEAILKDVEFAFRVASIVTVAFIRTMVALIRSTRNVVEGMGGGEAALQRFGLLAIDTTSAVSRLIASMALLADTARGSFSTVKGLTGLLTSGSDEELVAAYDAFVGGVAQAGDATKRYRKELDLIKISAAHARVQLEQFAAGGLSAGSPDDSALDALIPDLSDAQGLRDFFDQFISGSRSSAEAMKAPRRQLRLVREETDLATESAARLAAQMGLLAIEGAAEVARLRSSWAGAREATEQYKKTLSNFALGADLANGIFSSLEGNIAQFSDELANGKASFSDFTESVLRDISALIIKFLLLKAVRAGLGVNAEGGSTGGGVFGLLGFERGGVGPGPMVGHLPLRKYDKGGVASEPQLALFGEGRQREAFVPLPDGRSIPVEMRGGGGGDTITLNLNVQSLDPRTAADVILAQMPAIERQLAAALEGGRNRRLSKAVSAA